MTTGIHPRAPGARKGRRGRAIETQPDQGRLDPSRVAGLLLAAGTSIRFGGQSKALAMFDGEAVVLRMLRTMAGSRLGRVVVVTGHQRDEVRRVMAPLADSHILVESPDYLLGQSHSIRSGLTALGGPEAEDHPSGAQSSAQSGAQPGYQSGARFPEPTAILFVPVDQPLLNPAVIDHLIEQHEGAPQAVLVPSFDGRRRAPVLFPVSWLPQLNGLTGDQGGRQLFVEAQPVLIEVAIEDGAALTDFDTQEDLERLRRLAPGLR